MTTEPNRSQQRRERRAIPPFGDGASPNAVSNVLDNVLAECRFAPFADVALGAETHLLAEDEVRRPIEPRFRILLDRIEELWETLGLQPEDLEIGLSVRNRHLRRYEILGKWTTADLPIDNWSPAPAVLTHLQSEREIDFILAVRVASSRPQLKVQGLGANKVLCRRVFSVREPSDASTFPFRWAKFGEGTGYPEEALWVIEPKSPYNEGEFGLPVSDLLTVLVNASAQTSLQAMDEVRGSSGLAWRMLAADITTQIWANVLSKFEDEPDEDDRETLAGQVFSQLATASGLPYADIKELVGEDDHNTELRNLVARIIKVVV